MATNYPSSLDSFTNPTATDTLDSATVPHADQHDNINDAVLAIETELGTNPKGAKASVKARLDAVDTTISTQAMPVGGTTGQLLSKINSTDYNTQWVDAGLLLQSRSYVSTRYYSGFLTATGNNTFSAGVTRYSQFYVFETATFDRITIRTGTNFSGSATVRLGIFNDSSNLPSTVLLDAGTVNPTAANTYYEITISQSLSKGWYWFAANTTTAATTNSFQTGSANLSFLFGGTTAAGSGADSATQTVSATSGFSTASATAGSTPYIMSLRKS